MNKQNKKFKDLCDIFPGYCLFFVILFFFNHNFSKHRKNAKPEKQHEYVIDYRSSAISQNHELKNFKPQSFFLTFPELNRKNLQNECEQRQITIPGKDFLQIKILLKLNRYNLYFASGFHEPPLAA